MNQDKKNAVWLIVMLIWGMAGIMFGFGQITKAPHPDMARVDSAIVDNLLAYDSIRATPIKEVLEALSKNDSTMNYALRNLTIHVKLLEAK